MPYRIRIEEERVNYKIREPNELSETQKVWETTDYFELHDQKTVAGSLRAIADRFDPPKAEWRQ